MVSIMIKKSPQKTNIRFKVFLLLSIFYAFLIFYISSQSSLGDPRSIFNFLGIENLENIIKNIEQSQFRFFLYPLYIFSLYPDKVEHIVLYAGFGFLLYYALRNSSNSIISKYAFLFSMIIGIVYGASDEFHQSFVPGRTASTLDLLADGVGVFLSQILIFGFTSVKKISSGRLKNKGKMQAFDLYVIIILIVLSILFILVSPYNESIVRIVLALPLLLFLPGYLLIAVMFPKRGELGPVERFTLSIGLSIAITVFDGFALNYTPWGFRPNSIVISLSLIMGLLLIFAFFQRWRLGDSGYSFSVSDIISFYHTIRSEKPETGPDYDPALEKMLIRTMIIAIFIVSAMLVYAKVTTEPEKFTALYILGENGKAENYPTEISIGDTSHLLVGIENYEYSPVNYTLLVKFGDNIINQQNITLDQGDKWLNNVTFEPQLTSSLALAGSTPQKLEFSLLKDNMPYRSVHLLVKANLDFVNFSDVPDLENGDMETDKGWIFSNSSPNITGGYNYTTNSSSRAYGINFTGDVAGSYGMLSQNLTTDGFARTRLSFDIKDSEPNISYYIIRQALLDEKVIWESPVGGKNDSWEHIEVPILLSGNNILSFRVYGKYGSGNVTAWLDNVQLNPYAGERKIKPVRKEYEFNFDVRGEPIPLERSIKIDGFKFQGFKYDLNENKSYEELLLSLSDNNIIEPGNAVYITRTSGSDMNLMSIPYRILNNDILNNNSTMNISRSDIPQEKTLSLGEIWTLGEYSLSVKLISSKFDSAMLELKKGGKVVNTQTIKVGANYDYSSKVGKNITKIFRGKIKSIDSDNVYLTDVLSYSNIIELENGAIIGDFELVNSSSDEFVFRNSNPIELADKTVILNGNLGFRISGDELYPYSKGTPLRGTPQYTTHGTWMNITGFNFPGFYFENDTSFEQLRMYFTGDGFVEQGNAVYESKVHSNKLSFLGNAYELIYPGRPGYLSNLTVNQLLNISDNETLAFNGYDFSYKKIDNNSVQLRIRKSMTKDQQKLYKQAVEANSSIFPDVNYEIFTGNNNKFKKSNILNVNDSFEYREELRIDQTYKKIGGELINIENNSIELTAKFYDIPFEIYPGKSYNDFDVYSIDSDSIILKNNKPLLFGPGNETSILGDTLKIKTSSNESLAFPMK